MQPFSNSPNVPPLQQQKTEAFALARKSELFIFPLIRFHRPFSDFIRFFYAAAENRGIDIVRFHPVRDNIRAKVCVAVDAAVGTGVIRANVVTFGTAAMPALPVAAHIQGRACDTLYQRLVNTAVVLNSMPYEIDRLRAGGKGKSAAFSDAGKLSCEAVQFFRGKAAKNPDASDCRCFLRDRYPQS